MKKYKACHPSETINKIRNILNSMGIFLREIPYTNSKYFQSCKVMLHCGGLEYQQIASNGKGMSYTYALASAYAEFMERLQNNLLISGSYYASSLFLKNINKQSSYFKKIKENDLLVDFLFDPREKYIPVKDIVENHYQFCVELFPFIKTKEELKEFLHITLGFETIASVPFYSHQSKKEEYLPYELILIACGSNGMCSGNTQNEALIQGFCELFERYAGYKIYRENLTPPDIPMDYFKGKPIYNILLHFADETNYKIIIKDCSLGIGLPVIGILVIDQENRKYNFNLGASLAPDIALERCLTEIHQNPMGIYWNDINLDNYSGNPRFTSEYIYLNGDKVFTDGTGFWPHSIFNTNFSYNFTGLNYSLNESDESDLEYIKSKINKLGYSIYIRDVSFLGFNSYYIVIPGMSQFPQSENEYKILGDTILSIIELRNLKNLSNNRLKEICETINANYTSLKINGYRLQNAFFYNTNHDLNDLEWELFLFMLNYKVRNFEKAHFYLKKFLNNKPFAVYKYYYGIRDYVYLLLQGQNNLTIKNSLSHLYPDEIDEIIEDLSNPDDIFKYHELPSCYDCNKCEIENNCLLLNMLKLNKTIQKKQKDNIINQSKLNL